MTAGSWYSAIMLYQKFQIILAVFNGLNTLTGNRITGAFSWTYHLITNGTKVITGTVPLPALAFLAYNLPTTVRKITKKLDIDVKDIPKVLFDQRDKPKIRRWRRF